MIIQITGLQGGGKTYTGLGQLVQELISTERWIVVNLTELRLDELQRYMTAQYPTLGIDVTQRIQIIEKTETRRWYRYRGSFTADPFVEITRELPETRDARMEAYFAAIVAREPRGVCYILDEGHRHFPTDEAADYSVIARFYTTQMRHLSDFWWLITQNPEQVLPALRRLTLERWDVTNHYRQVFGRFKKPGCFYICHYYGCPIGDTSKKEPYRTSTVKLDKQGLGKCYYTRGALGVAVHGAETPPKKRALPFWAIYVIGVGVAVAAVVFLWGVPKALTGMLSSIVHGSQKTLSNQLPSAPLAKPAPEAGRPGVSPSPAAKTSVPAVAVPKAAPAPSSLLLPPLRFPRDDPTRREVAGLVLSRKGYRVLLSDGVVLTEDDKLVSRVDPSGVTFVDGFKMRFYARPPQDVLPAVNKDKVGDDGLPVNKGAAAQAQGADRRDTSLAAPVAATEDGPASQVPPSPIGARPRKPQPKPSQGLSAGHPVR